MILKEPDNKDNLISELEHLLAIAPIDRRRKINRELCFMRSGLKGERDVAYLIDYDFKDSPRTMAIHDLRLKINGRTAQIDHLLIHRTLNVFVLETKYIKSKLKITEQGDFLKWNSHKKSYEGIASPIAQNKRHIRVLEDAFKKIKMPSRIGFKLLPVFHSLVLVSPEAIIERPDEFDTSHIIKADILMPTIEKLFEKNSFIDNMSNLSRFVTSETLKEIGNRLIALHKPATFNYAAKFGLGEYIKEDEHKKDSKSSKLALVRPFPPTSNPRCSHCQSEDMIVQYGR